MNQKILSTIAAGLVAISFSAQAEEGFYIGVGAAANYAHDDEFDNGVTNPDTEYDWGWGGVGSLGYKYENGLRSELEFGYRGNDIDSVGNAAAQGDVQTMSAMLNVLYDFDITETELDTYVGVGGGIAKVDYDNIRSGGTSLVNDSDTVPAVQGIVGASYPVAESTDVFLNYQYFHAIDPDLRDTSGSRVDTDYDACTFLAGVKFNMYETPAAPVVEPKVAEAPAPAPAPAPEPVSRTYLVFFDFDKSELTQEAMSVLSQAAEDAKAGNAVAIKVIGHADRSGTDSYNMALSSRRSNTVKNALSDLGIIGGNIQTIAKGETDPLVPTEDGVREPQNRRAEILYVVTPQQ